MRILICGDRDFADAERVFHYIRILPKDTTIIEGEAPGADTLAGAFGKFFRLNVLPFPADWKRYGRAAGPIRNQQQLDEGKPHIIVAFHDNIWESKGTKDMLNRGLKDGVRGYLCFWNDDRTQIMLSPYEQFIQRRRV